MPPCAAGRPVGRANLVEAEVRKEVKARIPMWDAAGLAPTDQLMASAGPAMEAVGRYGQVLNHLGDPVDPAHYLVVARRAVEEAAAVVIDASAAGNLRRPHALRPVVGTTVPPVRRAQIRGALAGAGGGPVE